MTLAASMGYPVALKLVAPGVVHKADIGGVELGLEDATAVHSAARRLLREQPDAGAMVQQMAPRGLELILGAQRDPQFGPLLMFGLGGTWVEVLRDIAFRLAPLSEPDAAQMIAETSAGQVMNGVRGQPAADDIAVRDTLVRLGQLVQDFPCIVEMDINPLIVGGRGQGVWAVDVRIVVDSEP